MLKYDQIEKLEIIQKWLEEIVDSEEFEQLDIYPDVTLGDSLQGVEEVLNDYYPTGYEPPKPVMHLRVARPWHEKLKDHIFVALGEVAGTSLMVAAISGCASLFCWGISDIDKSVGNALKPDFAAHSQMYKGLAIASLGFSLGCTACATAIARGDK